jgi:gliding motility-associatede transport system auxiliary component
MRGGEGEAMSARRFALWAALAFFIMFVAGNLVANSWLRSWRLDLTQDHLYSLSPGTQHVLDGLTEPVELKFYYSRDAAAALPQLQAYGARVRELMQTFAARSHGKVRFVELDVKPLSDEEDKASEAGIEPQTLFQGADPVYFGVTGANAIDDKRFIPFLNPEREAFLEYEITRLIYELENPDPTSVALITSLPLDPAAAADPRAAGAGASQFAQAMGRAMHVTKLAPDFTEIPADTDVLVIIHPAPLTPPQAYAVDQFILRKGRAFIALDPAMIPDQQAMQYAQYGMGPQPQTSSQLEPLLSHWGVALSHDVVLDLDGALPDQAQDESGRTVQVPQPLFFRIGEDGLDHKDLMTAWLRRGLIVGLSGAFSVSERNGVTTEPLARTSAHTMHIPAERALQRPSPLDLLRDWPPAGGRIETVALRLSGNLTTAFPNGPPDGAAPPPDGVAPLTASATPAQIVLAADVDFLSDQFYLTRDGASMADNGSFALNAIDVLGGSDALVSLRSRAPSLRSMEMVDRMEAEAQRRIEQRQQELQGQLAASEQRLRDLQQHGAGSGFFAGDLGAELTPEERVEVERVRTEVSHARTELRDVGRDLRSDIDRLKAIVMFVNVWLAPMLVTGVGLFLFWRRQRRARGGART